MGLTGNSEVPKTSLAKVLHLLKARKKFSDVPDALEARTIDLGFFIS